MTLILTRPGRHSPLPDLVGDVETFLGDVYGRRPWFRSAGATGLPAFAVDDVDALVRSPLLRQPFFRVVRDGDTLAASTYTRTIRLSGGTAAGVVEPARVVELMDGGATLVLESAHRYVPPLARWCADLGLDLELPTQANVYVTPPGGAGFAPHVDSHDVFVLHLHGRKRWTIRDRSTSLPYPIRTDRGRLSDVSTVDTPVRHEWELRPGSVAYLPRGFPHSAAAGDDDVSIHVTVGILAPTVDDVFEAAVARRVRDRARDTIAPRAMSHCATDGVAGADVAITDDDFRAVLARRLVASLATPTASSVARSRSGRADDGGGRLVLAVDAVALEPAGEHGKALVAVLPDRELDFTPAAAPAAEFVLRAAADRTGLARADLRGIEAQMADALVAAGVLRVVSSLPGDDSGGG